MSTSDQFHHPGDDSRGFRRALGQFATGVTIVTTSDGQQNAGVTANSFSSVSLDPPLVLWSIAKTSQSLAIFQSAARFAINVLAANQMELAARFARSGPDKFEGVAWRPGLGGVPIFPGTAATFECTRHAIVEAGDHFVLMGQVERYTRSDLELLLFAQGRFRLAIDYPEGGSEGTAGSSGEIGGQTTMLGLLWDAFSTMSSGFQAHRDAEGLLINHGRILSLIERHPGLPLTVIARKAFISPKAAEEAIQALVDSGYACTGTGGGWQVTSAGLERVMGLRRRAEAFEADHLKSIKASDLDIARRVLRDIGLTRN